MIYFLFGATTREEPQGAVKVEDGSTTEEEPQGADQVEEEEAPTTVIPILDEGFRAALASSNARARSRSRTRAHPWRQNRLYCFNCMYINIIYGFWRTVHESTFSGVDRGPCHP